MMTGRRRSSGLPADLKAVDLRHHDIEQYHVRADAGELIQRLPSVKSDDGRVAFFFRIFLQNGCDLPVVVGNQYGRHAVTPMIVW
jgi:hypothetical protein